MINSIKNNDRDQLKLSSSVDSVYAILKTKPDNIKLGVVKNISTIGLLFEYIADDPVFHLDAEGVVDLICSELNIHLTNINCKVIYDKEVVPKHISIGIPVPMRECSLQFTEITNERSKQIESLVGARSQF